MTNDQMCAAINAMQADPNTFQWQAKCLDDGETHINFGLMYKGVRLEWHNCMHSEGYNSPLVSCCSCHTGGPEAGSPTFFSNGVAYLSCETSDVDTMVDLVWEWAKDKGVL